MSPSQDTTRDQIASNDPLFGRENLQAILIDLAKQIKNEDYYKRYDQLVKAKQFNLFWSGVQKIFWDNDINDFRVPTQDAFVSGDNTREEIQFVYDYVINIVKPHGESFIAALSSELPKVLFGPDDAMNPDDIRAAKLANNKAEHIQLYNKSKLMAIYVLYLFFCEGFAAAYVYPDKDKGYGEVAIPTFGEPISVTEPDSVTCHGCGTSSPTNTLIQGSNPPPESEDVNSCPSCGTDVTDNPTIPGQVIQQPNPLPDTMEIVTRQLINIYGLGNVKVPSFAMNQKDFPWLVNYIDSHYSTLRDKFQTLRDKIGPGEAGDFERSMRSSSVINSDNFYQYNPEINTLEKYWIRPSMFQSIIDDQETEVEELIALFPDGCCFSLIDTLFCESKNESMDECWRVTKAGPSKGAHADAVGKNLISINDSRNTLLNLMIQTIEYGIPSTFADPEVLDFDAYNATEASPGTVYPAQPKIAGSSIGNSFYDSKTSNLSKEALAFQTALDNDAQFNIGNVPSVYGGAAEGSKTLGEYQNSRAYALQRLSLPFEYYSDFYKETIALATRRAIKTQIADEKFTKPIGVDSFQTVWMKQADSKGKFDLMIEQVSSSVPISWEQKRSVMIQLLTMNSPEIMQLLGSTDNLSAVLQLSGLGGTIKVPNELQRIKQLQELIQLLNAAPTEVPDPSGAINPIDGMPVTIMKSTVPIEPNVDEDESHIDTLRDFMVSQSGLDHKDNNPAGYANCLAHFNEHREHMIMMSMPPPLPSPSDKPNPNKNSEKGKANNPKGNAPNPVHQGNAVPGV